MEYHIVKDEAEPAPGGLSATRVLYVLVPARTSPNELEAMAERIVVDARRGTPFERLSIEFIDYEEYASDWGTATIGRAQFGREELDGAKPGDYDTMKLTTYFPDKDWSRRPSTTDVAVFAAWMSNGSMNRDRVSRAVARRFGMTRGEVRKAVLVCLEWQLGPPGGDY